MFKPAANDNTLVDMPSLEAAASERKHSFLSQLHKFNQLKSLESFLSDFIHRAKSMNADPDDLAFDFHSMADGARLGPDYQRTTYFNELTESQNLAKVKFLSEITISNFISLMELEQLLRGAKQ